MEPLTITELSELLNISERTIVRKFQSFFDKYKNLYSKDTLIPVELAELVFNTEIKRNAENEAENDEIEFIEGFTRIEYAEFQKRINEYPVLKQYIDDLKSEIEFLRFNAIQQNETIKELYAGIKQRNFIEAKEKKFDQ